MATSDLGARRKNEKYGGFVVEPGGWAGLVRLGIAQRGVFALWQADDLGLSARAAQAQVATRRLFRVHHGVYSLIAPELLIHEGRCMAAVLACGRGAGLSHPTAADHLGLYRSDSPTIHVTVPTPGGRRRAGIRIHRSTTLRPTDVTIHNGIPCTTVARTILDIADTSPQRRVERVLDQAEQLEVLDMNALEEQITHNRSRRGATRLKAALEFHRPGSTPTWNEIEELMLSITRGAGFIDPDVQRWIDLGDGEPMIRGDFSWPVPRVLAETDGYRFHKGRRSFESDRRRDQRAIAAGWRPIRFTWDQLTTEPDRVERTLGAAGVPLASAVVRAA